jgi:lysophospholipase L1-like esterase
MKQQNKCDAILFNNGLHGWRLTDEEYGAYYEEMLQFLLKAGKPIYIVLTTDDIKHEDKFDRIIRRNNVAKALAEKYNLPVIDLYSVAISITEHHRADGVHFEVEGNEILAKCILENIR